MTKLHLVKEKMRTVKFTILPDSYRFGADKNLTVVTAYLMPNVELHRLVHQQIPRMKNELAVAFIVSNDYEEGSLELHCVSEHRTQYTLNLLPSEERLLAAAFTQTALAAYGYPPKDILNMYRGYANLAPL